MPVRLVLTGGTVADCTQAHSLTADLPAQYLLADRGYDTNSIVAEAEARGMEPVIPPRSHRKEPRNYDRALYKLRHLVENSFLDFNQWRAVATRYAKNEASFLAMPALASGPDQGTGNLGQIILTAHPRPPVPMRYKPTEPIRYFSLK